MRVTVDEEYEWCSLGVYLDDGTEIGRYTVVEDPEAERKELETMITKCCEEAVQKAQQHEE